MKRVIQGLALTCMLQKMSHTKSCAAILVSTCIFAVATGGLIFGVAAVVVVVMGALTTSFIYCFR